MATLEKGNNKMDKDEYIKHLEHSLKIRTIGWWILFICFIINIVLNIILKSSEY